MKAASLAAFVSVVTLLSACARVVPAPHTPFTDLNSAILPKQYKELSVALIFTDTTKATMKEVMQWVDEHGAARRDASRHAAAGVLAENMLRPLSKSFKAVERVANLEDAKASNADLIALLDLSAVLPSNAFSECKITMRITMLAADGKPIEIVTGQGINGDYLRVDEKVEQASTGASKEVESALYGSVKLVEFAKAKVSTGPVVTARPPAIMPVTEDDHLSLNDPRGVKVLGKAPSAFVAEQFGKSWAVVIGIDDYQKAPRLKYAVADARAMANVLRQQGFHVAELYNRQATKAAVEGELSDKLVDQVGEQDRVVIFYAGHGETKTVKGGKTMGYLLPVEGQQEALGQTAVSMGRIKELADALPSKQVLFLVDVCYGGIAGNQFRSTLPPMSVAYLKQITRERGRQLITAGGPDQQAMESPEWGHSVFTYYLLEGLGKGLADLNDDGIIPASELYSYLDSRVFSAAQLKGHVQRPELWSLAAEKGEFVFVPSKKQEQSR